MLPSLGTCLLALFAWAAPALAQTATFAPAPSAVEELTVRVQELEKRAPSAGAVRTSLDEARVALARTREAQVLGDAAAAERALRLARAALHLAERRYALEVERDLLRAASTRRDRARAQAEVAARARAREAERLRELESPTPAEAAP